MWKKTKQKRSSFACKLPALFGIARGVFYSNPPKKIKWLMKSGFYTFIIVIKVRERGNQDIPFID